MKKIGIITDSNSGFTAKEAKSCGINIQPMPFYVDGELKYEGKNFSQKEFYKALEKGSKVSTSMPIVGEVIDFWENLLRIYDELVYIPMSSSLSSSCETAKLIAEDYDGRIEVVDNRRISVTMKLSVYEAIELVKLGKSALEIREYLEANGDDSSIYLMVDTLEYLKKGGRITPAVAAVGTLLRIKPVLQIQGGKLDTFAKARTLKQGKQIIMEAIEKDVKERFANIPLDELTISIAHTQNKKEAEIFRDELLGIFPNKKIIIDPLSLSVACHVGPGSLAATVTKTFIKEM